MERILKLYEQAAEPNFFSEGQRSTPKGLEIIFCLRRSEPAIYG